MPSRNDPCPCGSGQKLKRCCLQRLHDVKCQLQERDEVIDDLVDWLRAEHEETVRLARSMTGFLMFYTGVGGNVSLIWAISDYRPEDGGPTLIDRYAQRPELTASTRDIAQGLAGARLGVYRVGRAQDGLWVELEPLSGGVAVRVASRDGLETLREGEILVGRVVTATALPTMWGVVDRFPGVTERCWRARVESLPDDPADAALAIIKFHPDDAAEPLPDGLQLHSRSWSIDDEAAVTAAIEEDDLWESLGEALPSGWAYAWPEDALGGFVDLGGWRENDGQIEIGRLIVAKHDMTVLSGDREVTQELAHHIERSMGARITPRPDALAA